MAQLRLDKIICDSGLYTRSEAKKLIKRGAVTVNERPVCACDEKFDPESERFAVEGRELCCRTHRYIMLYKPAGVLSATEDSRQETVLELLPPEYRKLGLFPVGRLDKDSTGLLLLTNDGTLGHALTSPGRGVEKLYEITVDGGLEESDAAAVKNGITLADGSACLPGRLEIDPEDASHGFVTITEGKYHQVKRMLASLGKPVRSLKRISEGGLCLDPNMEEGAYRELTDGEIRQIIDKL